MSFEQIRTASVIRFPYLWAREAASGETEGRKPRPLPSFFRPIHLDLVMIVQMRPTIGEFQGV